MSLSSSKKVKVEVESKTTKPDWLQLPTDVTANILFRLDTCEILKNARNVCSLWWKICKNPIMWKTIQMNSGLNVLDLPDDDDQILDCLVKICRYVVDLSCGHLKDIYISLFATDDLLKYIADRASQLRCIHLLDCDNISNEGLMELGMKLPQLEEMDISMEHFPGFCLSGKMHIYSKLPSEITAQCNADAFAIAKTMPGLVRLNISGNTMDDVGLFAILDGCPRLESLDIRRCFNLPYCGSLEERCDEQIKDLQYLDPWAYFDCWKDCKCIERLYGTNSENEDSSYHSSDSEFYSENEDSSDRSPDSEF